MYKSSLLKCFSIFKFIFIEHIIKRKSLRNTINRIKIRDRASNRHCDVSTQTYNNTFAGAVPSIYERPLSDVFVCTPPWSYEQSRTNMSPHFSQPDDISPGFSVINYDVPPVISHRNYERTPSHSSNISQQMSDNNRSNNIRYNPQVLLF